MCREGLLTEEQLERALSVQESTGRPLGEVIVKLGYASPGAVANALAEQYGGTLKTEYGVSAGLGRPRADQPVPALRRVGDPNGQAPTTPAGEPGPEAQLDAMAERARTAEVKAHQLEARVASLEAELAASRSEPEAPENEQEHLLFVPSGTGYSVLRRPGACPAAGSSLHAADGRPFAVVRIGPSPLGDGLRCAFLEPAA